MTARWTRDEVAAMAPDAASAKAGAALASPAKWPSLGRDDAALWGECQGSGKTPYRAAVDFGDAATKCSCPSRKFPCKHALGLMTLHAAEAVAEAARPDWVEEWLAARAGARKRKEENAAKPVDPATLEKRRAKRAAAMADGVVEARLWLNDALRGGLDVLRRRTGAEFSQMAARMVDAKAPGLADRALRISAAASAERWEEAVLREAALLHMLLRRAEADPELADRAAAALIGEPVGREEVLANGPGESGDWIVLGQHTQAEETGVQGEMLVRRVWLARRADARPALLLSFAHPKQPAALDGGFRTGEAFEGELAFYPDGLRALARRRGGEVEAAPAACADLAEADRARRARLAEDPWTERLAVVVDGLDVRRADGRWLLVDRAGDAVPLIVAGKGPWLLLALTRGRPARLTVEWDGGALRPLAVWGADGVEALNAPGGGAA